MMSVGLTALPKIFSEPDSKTALICRAIFSAKITSAVSIRSISTGINGAVSGFFCDSTTGHSSTDPGRLVQCGPCGTYVSPIPVMRSSRITESTNERIGADDRKDLERLTCLNGFRHWSAISLISACFAVNTSGSAF